MGILQRIFGGRETSVEDAPAHSPVSERSGTDRRPPAVEKIIALRGLRPLGNRKRLAWVEGKGLLMYAAIFGQQRQAEQYFQLMTGYARQNPPPLVAEIMVAYAPKTIYEEKYAFICPYPDPEKPAYREWVREAMLSCNDTLCQQNYFSGYGYDQVIPNLDHLIAWTILLPRDFDPDSPAGREMLADPPDGGFREVRLAR